MTSAEMKMRLSARELDRSPCTLCVAVCVAVCVTVRVAVCVAVQS